jgi:hypothetical protein
MATTVQARLDNETHAALRRLIRRHGWTTSQALRECILQADRGEQKPNPIQIIGLGAYDFGVSDLSTNKKYLAGLGQSSLPGGKQRRVKKAS